MRVLVVTAVVEEAETVLGALGRLDGPGAPAPVPCSVGPYGSAWTLTLPWGEAVVFVGGVGPAAAAAATATALSLDDVDLVLDAGVAGGFAPHAGADSVVLADRCVAADLGAEIDDEGSVGTTHGSDVSGEAGAAGFLPLDGMGFGSTTHVLDPDLVERAAATLQEACGPVVVGTVLTVSTVTGSAVTRAQLQARNPGAVAEAMEGFGVATAAAAHGVPVLELRTVSNPVGVSDRDLWDLPGAFELLGTSAATLVAAAPQLLDAKVRR